MANLETMTVGSTTYDIKDNATRTASKAMQTDSNGKLEPSSVTATELALLSGKTSDNLRKVTYGTSDMTAGSSVLATGEIYLMYEA